MAINGFGRIGRNFLRCWNGRSHSLLDVVAINDSGGVKQVCAVEHPSGRHDMSTIRTCPQRAQRLSPRTCRLPTC